MGVSSVVYTSDHVLDEGGHVRAACVVVIADVAEPVEAVGDAGA